MIISSKISQNITNNIYQNDLLYMLYPAVLKTNSKNGVINIYCRIIILNDILKKSLLTAVMKLEVFLLIIRKRSTKFGMMVSHLNWNKIHIWKITQTFTWLLGKQKSNGSIEWACLLVEQC